MFSLKMAAEALQLIDSNEDNTISLNTERVRTILLHPDIKDRYVSVISITGTFRTGKSLLLNFLLRYLRVKYVERRDVSEWLQPEDGPLSGFEWASGSEKNTSGILMWSEIFLTQLPSGDKAAVILLDTQGAFDHSSSVSECANIFALSALVSSTQIYNVMRNIAQYDFSNLACFGAYGTLFSDSAAFQNLCVLVRDWPFAYEKPYGYEGGSSALEHIVDTKNAEVKQRMNIVQGLFNKIDCFLMPSPGPIVAASKNFRGDLNDIDLDFKDYVQKFATSLLAPDNLKLKEVGGEKVTAQKLCYLIQKYANVLQTGVLPPVGDIYKATVAANYEVAVSKALELYKKLMDTSCVYNVGYYSNEELKEEHDKTKDQCIVEYDRVEKYKDDEIFDKYLELLVNKMDRDFEIYKAKNNKKREVELERQRKEQMMERQRKEEMMQLARRNTGNTNQQQSEMNWEIVGTGLAALGAVAVGGFALLKALSGRNRDD